MLAQQSDEQCSFLLRQINLPAYSIDTLRVLARMPQRICLDLDFSRKDEVIPPSFRYCELQQVLASNQARRVF